MSNEIQLRHTTAKNVYFQVTRGSDGEIWNTSGTPAFEAEVDANWGNYAVVMAEQHSSGMYLGSMPAVPLGRYVVTAFERQGGSPAIADRDYIIGSDTIDWDGTREVGFAGLIEGTLSFIYAQRIMLAALAGKSSNHEDGLPKYRDQADTKNRISATIDANHNRSAVSVDGS